MPGQRMFPFPANLRRALLYCSLAALPAIAQPNTPFVFTAENSASYNTNIAQGSLFVVYGQNLGPAQLVQASSYPLPNQLSGTQITVSSGSTTTMCPMVYTSAGAVAAIMPSNIPPGNAALSLIYNEQSTPFPVQINVVQSAVGIYTLSSNGLGPGIFTALDGSLKTFAVSAKAGDTITVWATGLGPITGPDNVVPATFPNFPGIGVFVGTQAAKVIYAGRSGCCAGLDQISFVVPSGISGCYLPVAISGPGGISNFVSIPAASNGGPCSDTAPTLPVSLMNQAAAGKSVKVAGLAIGPVAVLRGLGFDDKQLVAERLSRLLHVKVTPQDVAKLETAWQTHNRRALMRAMAKYAGSYKALDPVARAAVAAAVNLSVEGAIGEFGEFNTPGSIAAAFGNLFPSQGTCTVFTQLTTYVSRSGQTLDAGSSLALSGQAGSWTLMSRGTGRYQVMFGSTPSGPDVPPGAYAIKSSGGLDVPAFTANLNVGGNALWTNKAARSTINRAQPLTLTWSGGTTPGYVLIGGYIANIGGLEGFACAEDNSKGTFTIPSFILSALPAAATGGVMFISPHPLSQQVAIPGVDLSYFIDGSSDSKSVVYQ